MDSILTALCDWFSALSQCYKILEFWILELLTKWTHCVWVYLYWLWQTKFDSCAWLFSEIIHTEERWSPNLSLIRHFKLPKILFKDWKIKLITCLLEWVTDNYTMNSNNADELNNMDSNNTDRPRQFFFLIKLWGRDRKDRIWQSG